MDILILPLLLLTILYTINISFLLNKELSSSWKKITLFFNVFAFICSIPTAFLFWMVSSLDVTFGSSTEVSLKVKEIAIIVYFFIVNVILTLLMIKKKAVKNLSIKEEIQNNEAIQQEAESEHAKDNKLKIISCVFLYASLALLIYRSLYADGNEIFFMKGFYELEIYGFFILAFILAVIATGIIINLKNKKVVFITAATLGSIFSILLILNFLIKPNDFAALSKKDKEAFLLMSTRYLEEVYPEGIEPSLVKFNKSNLGGRYVRVQFNYEIADCEYNCGPYNFEADYYIKTHIRKEPVTDTGQRSTSGKQTIDSANSNVSFKIKDEEKIIQNEETQVFIEKGKEAEIKKQVFNLIDQGYAFSSNNGLPTHTDNHYDRLQFIKYKKEYYEKLVSIDDKDFYDFLLKENYYDQKNDTDFVLNPLGSEYGKIVLEVSPKGYIVKGLAFKTVDSRKRFVFDLGNGESFTGILESDQQFRMDRVWVTIEDEGTSAYQKGDYIEVKY